MGGRFGMKQYGWGLLAALTLLSAGCGRSVHVSPPSPVTDECVYMHTQLPTELAGERQLDVDPPTNNTAAWGSPTIVWRCGVQLPTDYSPTAQTVAINGVSWLPQQLESGARFTSLTDPRMEVTVPGAFSFAEVLSAMPVPQQDRATD